MSRSIEFFRDEVRNGFYIPTAIKQAWAAELDVLSVIDDICVRHGIKYFADWGTFLGAVRHGGFIPWDDDLDIAMLRPDYEKFKEIAEAELPKDFAIHDYAHKDNHWLFLTRIVNSKRMCFDEEYLDKHYNFPWLAGVDIFVKDYLFKDEEKEKERDHNILNVLAAAEAVLHGSLNAQSLSLQLSDIEKKYNVNLPDLQTKNDLAIALYSLAEKIMGETGYEESDKVGQIFPWILRNGTRVAEKKENYERFIRIPFEDTSIPVPISYIDTLSFRYRKYYEIHKVWKGHEYPFFEGQKEEMERLMGKPFRFFSYDHRMENRPAVDTSDSLKNTCKECMETMGNLLNDAEKELLKGESEGFIHIISNLQQLAVDMGILIEETMGEKRRTVIETVEALQRYCDSLWEDYQRIEKDDEQRSLPLSHDAFDNLSNVIYDNILKRKEVLFLPVGVKEWKGMEAYYVNTLKEPDTDIFVVPLPLMKKDYFGAVKMSDEEIDKSTGLTYYPDTIELTDWSTYDISIHCPDKVYIQNPYDGENPCLTVPSTYYAEYLRQYTHKLIYVPFAITTDINENDKTDIYNMKHYVTAPGVVYADEVIVQSENIRERYLDVLTDFAGKDTRKIWEEKIKISTLAETAKIYPKTKLLFCIGANELSERENSFADQLEKRLRSSFLNNDLAGSMSISIYFYPEDKKQWEYINCDVANRVYEFVENAAKEGKCNIVNNLSNDSDVSALLYDAYYGSPSPLMPAFLVQKKPVMLADYSIANSDF